MKTSKVIVVALFVLLFAFAVTSQRATITAQENQDCTTTYYNSTEPVYGYVTKTRDSIGSCYNPANSSYYPCVNGTETYQNYEVTGYLTVLRNNTVCHQKSFVVTTTRALSTERKEIDFSHWGVCVQSGNENGCITILCGSQHGGSAVNGAFNGCDGGKSCKKFLFCEDGIKVFVKGSQPDFVQADPTYHLPALDVKEVGQ